MNPDHSLRLAAALLLAGFPAGPAARAGIIGQWTFNEGEGTSAFVEGTGTNMFLFDPSGHSTAKLYRVAIRP